MATALTLLGINLIPAAHAGSSMVGATLPEQIVQEGTALQQYSKEVTSTLAAVQTQINTLNQYITDLQNLASLPAQELSKITMPYQQAMYDYQQATQLMNEYQSLYGNLKNIQSGMEQQDLNIINSALSPENYVAAVYQSQSAQEKANQAQIQSIVGSMQNVQRNIPIIQAQQAQMHDINGNVSGFQQLSAQLTTLENQNQEMLTAIQQAQLQKSQATGSELKKKQAQELQTSIYGYEAARSLVSMQNGTAATLSSANAADEIWKAHEKCTSQGKIMTANGCV